MEKSGFKVVEIVSEHPHFLSRDNWEEIHEAVESTNLRASVHAPFGDLNTASFNERIRKASLEVLEETLEASSRLEAIVVTIHPGHCSPVSRKYQARYLETHRGGPSLRCHSE